MRKAFLASIFLLVSAQLSAQIIKIEDNELDADTAGIFTGDVTVNLNVNNRSATPEQNLVYRGLEFQNNMHYLTRHKAFLLINKLTYFRITDGPLVSTGFAHLRAVLQRKQTVSYEFFSQVQYDDGRRMKLRYLFGGGLKIAIADNDDIELYTGIGIMNEFERWRPFEMEVDDIERRIWKNTSYLSGDVQISENFSIHLINYYQGGYDNVSEVFRHRLSGDLSINAKITGKLTFTTNFTLLYESNPIININPVVYSLTNGIQYQF